MFLLFPLSIETLERYRPWMNWLIIAVTVVVFFWSGGAGRMNPAAVPFVLKDWTPSGLFGHMFLHAGFMHLIGNMIFLWVFGNVICQTTGNIVYLLLYFGTGVCAAAVHLMLSNSPAIGASGAISGVTGLTLALFPLNIVNVGYVVGARGGSFEIKVVTLCIVSFLWDLAEMMLMAHSQTAHWAHIGGLLAGIAIGLICLHFGWIVLSCFDNKSLYEMITKKELERSQDELDTGNDHNSAMEDWS
jgi:membrane associated rhomboid family serine protease